MELFSTNCLYIGYESDKYCDLSIHLGNFLLEYQCPNAKGNGTIQKDNRSGDGETPEGNGAIQELRSRNTSTSN